MTEPLLLNVALHEKIWGGTKLATDFGFAVPSDQTGEAWVISGHPNGPTTVKNGEFSGLTLEEIWEKHPEVFGRNGSDKDSVFPLLVKILDANQDLSVQVHPDDQYAQTHGSKLGKTESWYIMDAKPGAEIYYGHTAMTHDEFNQAVDSENWSDLLQKIPVKPGDFFYVPAGTLHALGAGTLVLETQQSSDITYRVYDFDRVDQSTGVKRDLHLVDAKNVTTVPFSDQTPDPVTKQLAESVIQTILVEAPYFNVYKYEVNGTSELVQDAPYTLVTVIEGDLGLSVDGQSYNLKAGASFVLPNDVLNWTVGGNATLIVSTPGPNSIL